MITCTNNQIENKEYPSWTAVMSKLVGKICVFTSYSSLQLSNIYVYIYTYIYIIYIHIYTYILYTYIYIYIDIYIHQNNDKEIKEMKQS